MSIRNQIKQKMDRKAARHSRVRAKVSGTDSKPRMCVFRSNKHITVQLVDDQKRVTLAVCNDMGDIKKDAVAEGLKGKCATAFAVGIVIAGKAQELKIKKVVFDRGCYRYHGRVKSLADGARKGGLEF